MFTETIVEQLHATGVGTAMRPHHQAGSFSHPDQVPPFCPGSPSRRRVVFPRNFYYTILRELFRFLRPINSIILIHI